MLKLFLVGMKINSPDVLEFVCLPCLRILKHLIKPETPTSKKNKVTCIKCYVCYQKMPSYGLIKRPTRDACLCMGDLQAPPAPHFVFLITL